MRIIQSQQFKLQQWIPDKALEIMLKLNNYFQFATREADAESQIFTFADNQLQALEQQYAHLIRTYKLRDHLPDYFVG